MLVFTEDKKTENSLAQPDPHQITAENAYLYSPDARKPRVSGRLKQFWDSRPRPQQVLLIVGVVTIVFSALMIGLSINTAKNKTNAKTSQSTIASNQQTNSQSQSSQTTYTGFEDENQNGIDDADEASTTSEDGVSWWQKLLNSVSNKSTDSAADTSMTDGTSEIAETSADTADDTSTTYTDDQIAYDYTANEDVADEENIDIATPPAEDSPDTPAPTPSVTSTFTLASWNTLYTNSPSNVVSGASAIAKKAEIIGFQELNFTDRRRAIRDKFLCSSCAYAGYIPNYSENGWATKATVSIIWNKKRFNALDKGTYHVLGPNAYGANTSSKWINWVKLKAVKTNKVFYVLNTHFTAGATSKGHPSSSGGAVKNYIKHMNDLVGQIKRFRASNTPVFITGDFNINYRYDKNVKYKYFAYSRLNGIDVHSNWDRLNVKGVNSIDYVWSTDNSSVKANAASRANRSYGSDHKPVFYRVTLSK